ncbi:hypothetical protein IF2G_01490 [Cordyceps javanica]|nr:hypothetical protein IF2G_01490 [Cordyceps javanica]
MRRLLCPHHTRRTACSGHLHKSDNPCHCQRRECIPNPGSCLPREHTRHRQVLSSIPGQLGEEAFAPSSHHAPPLAGLDQSVTSSKRQRPVSNWLHWLVPLLQLITHYSQPELLDWQDW